MLIAVIAALQTGLVAPPRDPCLDDNGRNICAAQVKAEILAKMGVEPIEAEQAGGAEVYRVRMVDGYGRDQPVIAFVRRPGTGPMVEVSGEEGRKRVASVSKTMWDDVRSEARFADRQLVPLEGDDSVLCFHGWVITIEMANTYPREREPGPVRTVVQSACQAGLAMPYGFKLAAWAKAALPDCETIDADKVRGDVGLLSLCLALEGDRVTAASLFNAHNTGEPRRGLDRTSGGVWRAYLGTNGSPRLNWDGQEIETDRQRNNLVAEFIGDKVKSDPNLRFYPSSYRGLTSRRGEISGVVHTGDNRKADYQQTWVWDPNLRDWMLESWTVGAFSSTD